MVRSVKELLRKELQQSKLNYDQMLTLLLEIESIINNRPITYVYPKDLEPCVTPNHLLYGRKLSFTALKAATQTLTTGPERDQVVKVIQHFWERWRREYVVNLREHHKLESRNDRQPYVQIGDVVLIHDENLPRSMGVATEVLKGADNQVRGAVVGTKQRTFLKRPINMLFPIEYVRNTEHVTSKAAEDVTREVTQLSSKRPVRNAAIIGDL